MLGKKHHNLLVYWVMGKSQFLFVLRGIPFRWTWNWHKTGVTEAWHAQVPLLKGFKKLLSNIFKQTNKQKQTRKQASKETNITKGKKQKKNKIKHTHTHRQTNKRNHTSTRTQKQTQTHLISHEDGILWSLILWNYKSVSEVTVNGLSKAMCIQALKKQTWMFILGQE